MSFMNEYDYTISYAKGTSNKADPLSRRSDFDDGSRDNEDQILLPESKFESMETLSDSRDIKERLSKSYDVEEYITKLISHFPEEYEWKEGLLYHKEWLYIPKGDKRKDLLIQIHESPLAGHPGSKRLEELTKRSY